MLAPRFLGQGRIEFYERPVPVPGAGELLLRLRANALCGSERGQYRHGSQVTPGRGVASVPFRDDAGDRRSPAD